MVISSLHETKSFDAKKTQGTMSKNPQQIHSALEKDVNTADKNTNQDDSQHIERGVTNVASSTILKMYAEVPGAAQLTPLKRKLFTSNNLALNW